MIASPGHSEPIRSVLTARVGRSLVRSKLNETKAQACGDYGQPLSSCIVRYRIGKCQPVGKTVVCAFRMRMRSGVTCHGRVQVRIYNGDAEGRYVGPVKHPKNVVCKAEAL